MASSTATGLYGDPHELLSKRQPHRNVKPSEKDRECGSRGRLLGFRSEASSDQTPARVNVTWVTPLGEEVASTW